MLGVKRIGWAVIGALWAGLACAHVRLVPGQWRMTAKTAAGDLHYSACLKSHDFAGQILQHEGHHCRMATPVVIHGSHVTVVEDCRVAAPGTLGAMVMRISAQLQLQPGGRAFTGVSHAVMTTPLGRITEHEQIAGVRTGACAAP